MQMRWCQAINYLCTIPGKCGSRIFFLEFHHHLSNELAWAPLFAEPTHGLKSINGGISQVMAKVVKLFFKTHFDLKHAGIQLVGPDGAMRHRLFAKMDQDGGEVAVILLMAVKCLSAVIPKSPS